MLKPWPLTSRQNESSEFRRLHLNQMRADQAWLHLVLNQDLAKARTALQPIWDSDPEAIYYEALIRRGHIEFLEK